MTWFPTKWGSTGSGTSNILTAAEIDVLDGVTAGTVLAGKAVVTTTDKHIDTIVITDGGLKLGAAAGTAVTATAAELNYNDRAGAVGVAEASKTAVLGANKNLDTLVIADSGLYLGAVAGTAVTATAANLNLTAGVTAGTTAAGKVVSTATGTNKVASLDITDLKIGGTSVASTAAQLDAAVAGTPLIYRTSHLAAAVTAGTGVAVPAVAGQRFHVLSILMRATGGNVSGPATVGVKEDAGAIFLSHVIADLAAGVWHNHVTGTPVITGITSGGTTAVANKGLLVYCAGGDATYATATGFDVVVCGFYTTT
jgi:hypothetical protein